MKIVTAVLAASVLAISLPAVGAPRIKPPKDGRGVVVFELVNPGPIISDKADYTIVTGHRDSSSDSFIQETLIRSFPLFRDTISGKLWLIDDVPAGDTVLWGFNVQTGWQARFDGSSLHFVVPDGGYVFGGTINGLVNRTRIEDAITIGKLPKILHSGQLLVAMCGQTLTGYTAPEDGLANVKDADSFLDQAVKSDVKLQVASTTIAPFVAKVSGGWINAPTHTCIADNS